MSDVLKKGQLSQGGKIFQIVKSRNSCLREGIHAVCVLPVGEEEKLFNHQNLKLEEMAAAFTESIKFCRDNSVKERWKIVLNGPGLLKAPWFHIHSVLPSESPQILREVWRPTEHLEKLKQFSKKLELSLKEEFQEIVDSFERNLK